MTSVFWLSLQANVNWILNSNDKKHPGKRDKIKQVYVQTAIFSFWKLIIGCPFRFYFCLYVKLRSFRKPVIIRSSYSTQLLFPRVICRSRNRQLYHGATCTPMRMSNCNYVITWKISPFYIEGYKPWTLGIAMDFFCPQQKANQDFSRLRSVIINGEYTTDLLESS